MCGFFYTLSVSLRSPAPPKGEPTHLHEEVHGFILLYPEPLLPRPSGEVASRRDDGEGKVQLAAILQAL